MTRRWIWKITVTAALAVIALWAAVTCAGTFRHARAEAISFDGLSAEYVLRDWKGYVTVFDPDAPAVPLQITGIRTAQLRRADQKLLEGGLTVGSREQLLLLLEDLGD